MNDENKGSIWDDPIKITCLITTCVFLYGAFTNDEVNIFIGIIGALFIGPIVGFFIYSVSFILWLMLSDLFSQTTNYAKNKGVPKPFAIIFGLICSILMLFAIG